MFKAIIELLAAFFKSADTAGRIAEKSLPTPETRAEMDKRKFQKQTEAEMKKACRTQRNFLNLVWNKNIKIEDRINLVYGKTWSEEDRELLISQLKAALPKHK